ncbi:hypothetical protein [Streptomyces canus]|uniref:hypothetical protein n=1 Tax=Streptomyces canus TaxID=58343 RepID=UPI00131A3A32|nr:hypothetical protein [Streptomyces canus]
MSSFTLSAVLLVGSEQITVEAELGELTPAESPQWGGLLRVRRSRSLPRCSGAWTSVCAGPAGRNALFAWRECRGWTTRGT